MKKKNIYDIETTFAHNEVARKALLKVGESKSCIQTLNYAWLEKGESFSPHKHDDCEEFYFFIKGEGKMKINESEFEVKEGDFVVVEKGEFHGLQNKGEERLIFFTVRVKLENE